MDSISVTLTNPRVIDGFISIANDNNMSPEDLIVNLLNERGGSLADNRNIGVITSAAFIARFTPAEYGAILEAAETNEGVAALIAELTSSPKVAFDDPRLAPGLALLVAEGLIEPERLPTLLAYERPAVQVSQS